MYNLMKRLFVVLLLITLSVSIMGCPQILEFWIAPDLEVPATKTGNEVTGNNHARED